MENCPLICLSNVGDEKCNFLNTREPLSKIHMQCMKLSEETSYFHGKDIIRSTIIGG